MKRSIDQFLASFPELIAERGEAIYDNGDYRVYTKNDMLFDCDVYGTYDNYQVKLFLEDDKIIGAKCSCPYYEGGKMCKHIYAVTLALKDRMRHSANKKTEIAVPTDEKDFPAKYKVYQNDGTFTKDSMTAFLAPLIQGQKKETLLSLCKITKRKTEFTYFLETLCDSVLKEWFFSSVTEKNLPSPLFRYFIDFMVKHTELSGYLNNEALAAALDNDLGSFDFFFPMFEEAMILNQKERVKLFSNSLMAINYISDDSLFRFLSENEKTENYVSYFEKRLKKGKLFKFEYAFLFPYLTEEEKSKYLFLTRETQHGYYSYDYGITDDYSEKRFITQKKIRILGGTAPESVNEMSLIDFGAFRNTIFRQYKSVALRRFKTVIAGFNRKKSILPYEVFCAYLVFRDCLEDYPELKVSFERFLDKMQGVRGLTPQIHGCLFELMKKTGYLNENCTYVDFEEGTKGFDAMDIGKTDEKEITEWY